MTNTAAAIDEVWGWLYQPLQDLKQDCSSDPNKPWDACRKAFLEQLGLSDPNDHPVTHVLIHRLDELSDEERHRLLAADGIDTMAYEVVQECTPPDSPADESATYDEAAWHDFLVKNLPTWNGIDDSWNQFAEWFSYHATQANLGTPAQAFIDHLAVQSNAERISTCAQYGVIIAAPAAAAAVEVEPAAAEPAVSADESARALMAEILKERPELTAIPEARRLELIAQVFAEPDEDEEGED